MKRSRSYQKSIIEWGSSLNNIGLFLDMRMGKILVTLRILRAWGQKGPVLIVPPYSAFDGWKNDIKDEPGEYETVWLEGPAKKRLKTLEDNYDENRFMFFFLSKEGHLHLPEIRNYYFWTVVIDESRFIAANNTASKFYLSSFRDAEHRVILTGTADYKNKLDYYNQLTFLESDALKPFKSFWEFRNNGFYEAFYKWLPKKKTRDIIVKALNRLTYTLRRKDLNLGREKIYITKSLKFNDKLRTTYNQMEETFIKEFEDKEESTIYAPVNFMWLQQLTGGHIDGKLIYKGKIEELKNILDNDIEKNEQVVIVCSFIQEIQTLQKELSKKHSVAAIYGKIPKPTRSIIKKDFLEKKFKLLIAEGSIIARGVDLKSAKTLIFYSQPRSAEVKDQVEDRVITLEDSEHVAIINMYVKNTVDEDRYLELKDGRTNRDSWERVLKRSQKEIA